MSSTILIDPHNQVPPLPPHPDNLTLEPLNRPTIGIDAVRDAIRWAYRKPFQRPEKKILIRQAQYLTEEAQNALLKILEEPPEETKIILAVSHPDHLLPTVRSRCSIKHLSSSAAQPTPDPPPQTLLPTSIEEAFKTAEKLSQLEQPVVVKKLETLILALRRENFMQHWKKIQAIQAAKEQILNNVNPRLALEDMFLRIVSK